MSIETEQRIHDTPPTVTQLRALARIGIGAAVKSGGIRRSELKKGITLKRYYYENAESVYLNESAVPFIHNHRVGVNFGIIHDEQRGAIVHLNYHDTHRISGIAEAAFRTTTRFQWRGDEVIAARRSFHGLDAVQIPMRNIEDYLDGIQLPADIDAILHAENEMSLVSQDDCAILIDEMSDYFEATRESY